MLPVIYSLVFENTARLPIQRAGFTTTTRGDEEAHYKIYTYQKSNIFVKIESEKELAVFLQHSDGNVSNGLSIPVPISVDCGDGIEIGTNYENLRTVTITGVLNVDSSYFEEEQVYWYVIKELCPSLDLSFEPSEPTEGHSMLIRCQ